MRSVTERLCGNSSPSPEAGGVRIANSIKAIEDGRMSGTLLSALDKAEADKEAACRQIEEADNSIRAATVQRPTTAQVQEAWDSIGRVRPVLTEEERADLMGSFVQVVELISYSDKFALNSQMEAGVYVATNYPPISFPDFEVSRIPREF